MAFLTPLLVYVGAVGGIVVVLLMSLTAFLAGPNRPVTAPRPLSIASRPSVAAAATPATTSSMTTNTALGRWGPRVALGVAKDGMVLQMKVAVKPPRNARLTNKISRERYPRKVARQEVANRWASQQEPDFEYRPTSYDDPADRTRLR